jgi:hypothetical protein
MVLPATKGDERQRHRSLESRTPARVENQSEPRLQRSAEQSGRSVARLPATHATGGMVEPYRTARRSFAIAAPLGRIHRQESGTFIQFCGPETHGTLLVQSRLSDQSRDRGCPLGRAGPSTSEGVFAECNC